MLSDGKTPAPPLWEVGLSISMMGGALVDSYDVRSFHDLFRGSLPVVERQPPFAGLQVHPGVGAVVNPQPQFSLETVHSNIPSRWWFLSPVGERLLQVQENFIGYNWRRLAIPPALPVEYPGFSAMKATLDEALEKIEKFHAVQGRAMPQPMVSELLYDNLISMTAEDGRTFRLREVIEPLNFGDGLTPLTHFAMSWSRELPGYHDPTARVQVAVASVGVPPIPNAAPKPYIRLTMSARSTTPTWQEVSAFFDAAHAEVHHILDLVVMPDIKQTWNIA